MSSMRSGFKNVVGSGNKKKKKESLLSKIIWYAIMAAAIGVIIYRFTR